MESETKSASDSSSSSCRNARQLPRRGNIKWLAMVVGRVEWMARLYMMKHSPLSKRKVRGVL